MENKEDTNFEDSPKPNTEEWDFMLDGALAFINSGQYEQMFGKIGDKEQAKEQIMKTPKIKRRKNKEEVSSQTTSSYGQSPDAGAKILPLIV